MTSNGRTVVVTGVGVVAPTGLDRERFFQGLLSGTASPAVIDLFPSEGFVRRHAAQVQGFDPASVVPKKKALKLMGRQILLALAAAAEAFGHAGLAPGKVAAERMGVTLGGRTRLSDFEELEASVLHSLGPDGRLDMARYATEGLGHVYPLSMLKNLPNMAAAHVSIAHGALGPSNTITDGAPSGLQAIGESFRTIVRGDADVMLAGGTDSLLSPLDVLHLSRLGLLAPERDGDGACRPFDQAACGLVPGEGAAVLVLEEEAFARARGSRPLARLLGFAEGFEPGFDGRGAAPPDGGSWRRALRQAGISSREVRALTLSGSGHRPWDDFEAALAQSIFGDGSPPAFSSRAHLGAAGAAQSALDVAAAVLSARAGLVPPTAGCTTPTLAAARLDLVCGGPRHVAGGGARLVGSLSAAGHSAALVLAAEPSGGAL